MEVYVRFYDLIMFLSLIRAVITIIYTLNIFRLIIKKKNSLYLNLKNRKHLVFTRCFFNCIPKNI